MLLSPDKKRLQSMIAQIQEFLRGKLKLTLHPDKIILKTIVSGVDFLGWVNFTDHRVLRIKTKQRMLKRIRKAASEESLQSYLGLLSHGNSAKIRRQLLGEQWLWRQG